MTVQNNSAGFHVVSNRELILPSPRSLILPGHGLQVQSPGLESRQAGDEQASIIQEAKATKALGPYSQVKGIFVPGNIGANSAIELVNAGDSTIHYGQQEKDSFSFEEVLHNSLEKIIKSEADNTSIEDIKAYFGRLEDTTKIIKHTDSGFTNSGLISRSPLVMNRETFKEETYYPLKEFSLTSNSLEQLENIVLKSLNVEGESKSSPAKRFALRFLTNTVFIEGFKSEKIREAVIQGLKTDREPAAKKIYEHYLTTQLGNLEHSQKKEIIDALNKNSRLSSHLAQSLFLGEPSLKEGIEIKEFPLVNNFEDLEKILQNLHAHSKVAMNQINLLPPQINPDANYGIEIELKLAGSKGERDDNSPIQKLLKPYASFIELGIDFGGSISEMRTLDGGFKLNEENQRNLFEILNIFHKSPELMLFLSQHVHLDKESDPPSDLLLSLMQNDNNKTLETKSLDLDTVKLSPNNNLIYSYQVPNLIDQMVVLGALKNTKPSAEAILKSFELKDKYGISLHIAQVMLTAVENGKDYLIPNLLRLNSEGKNYLETNYFAKDPEDLICKMIKINREELVEFLLSKVPESQLGEVLTLSDKDGHNALMIAACRDKKDIAEFLLSKVPESQLGEVLTKIDQYGRNALMIAAYMDNKDIAELILSKVPESQLGEVLTLSDQDGHNALMLAIKKGSEKVVELLLNTATKNLNPDEFTKFLTKSNNYGISALWIAARSGNEKIVALLLNTATEKLNHDEFTKFFTKPGLWDYNALEIALNYSHEKIVELILKTDTEKLSPDEFTKFLTEAHEDGDNALMLAIEKGSEKVVELLLNTATKKLNPDEFTKFLTKSNNDDNNALGIAARSGNEKIVALLLKTATEKLNPDELKEFLTKRGLWDYNALEIAEHSGNEKVVELLLNTCLNSDLKLNFQ